MTERESIRDEKYNKSKIRIINTETYYADSY